MLTVTHVKRPALITRTAWHDQSKKRKADKYGSAPATTIFQITNKQLNGS